MPQLKAEEIERRAFSFEFRAGDGEDSGHITGYGAVFNQLSENLGGFRELILPGAFDDVLEDDVRALFNHDANLILGRTAANTLSLSVDSAGLRYEFDLPETTYAQDLGVSIRRGDISQSSFAFWVEDDKWEEDEDGRLVRSIIKMRKLYDVSPVTYPGYADTSVAVRGLEQFNQSKLSARSALDAESRARELEIINA